jgi:hypothetical protein
MVRQAGTGGTRAHRALDNHASPSLS